MGPHGYKTRPADDRGEWSDPIGRYSDAAKL